MWRRLMIVKYIAMYVYQRLPRLSFWRGPPLILSEREKHLPNALLAWLVGSARADFGSLRNWWGLSNYNERVVDYTHSGHCEYQSGPYVNCGTANEPCPK